MSARTHRSTQPALEDFAPLDARGGYTSFVNPRARIILILLVLAGAGIAVATGLGRPEVFVPGALVLNQTIPVGPESEPVQVAFIPGKDSLLYGAKGAPVAIIDLASGTRRELFSEPAFGNFALSADGTSAAILMHGPGTATTEMRICDLASGKVNRTISDRRGSTCWTWSPDGHRIVFAVTWMLFILDLDRGETQTLPLTDNHSDHVNSLAFSPDGRFLGIGTWGGEVSLWRTDTWTLVQKLDLGSDPDPRLGRNGMCTVAFSPDSTLFAAGGGSSYGGLDIPGDGKTCGALRVWRIPDLKVALAIDPERPIYSLSLSPDRATLAYSTRTQVHVVELSTGKDICRLEAPTLWSPRVEFGQDGRLMTLDGRGGIRIWKRAR